MKLTKRMELMHTQLGALNFFAGLSINIMVGLA
jgi:hypothetical protein